MVEAVQRWRLAFSRSTPALELGQAEIARSWELALASASLPLVMSAAATPRPRLSFAAPLAPGLAAEHELADLVLAERWTIARCRSALAGALPPGFELVDLFDVWLGAPALTAALAAMTYRVAVAGPTIDELRNGVRALLGAERLDRTRSKGSDRTIHYDLRPLIMGLAVTGSTEMPVVRLLVRSASEGPSGRPDEVLLAIGEAGGGAVTQLELVRERLWTADEVPTF